MAKKNEINDDFFDEDVESIEEIDFDGLSDSAKEIIKNARDAVKKAANDLIEKIDESTTPEKMAEYEQQFKGTVNDIVDKANNAINQFKQDPKTMEYWNKAQDAYKKASDTVVTAATDIYNKAMENENIKNAKDVISKKSRELFNLASEKYQEFIHDEKVRKTVVTTVNAVNEAINKAIESVKENKEDSEKEE